MQTVNEWLEILPVDLARQVADNICHYATSADHLDKILKRKVSSLKEALLYSFFWADTKEGPKYWANIASLVGRLELSYSESLQPSCN